MNVSNAKITGVAELRPKHSAVDRDGQLKLERIEGLEFRPTRPVPHEDGHVIEIVRAEWDIVTTPIVQVHMTTTLPGRVRAWGLHRGTVDRLFVAKGLVRIACYDGREGSETHGRVNELTLSDRNPGLVVIGPNLYHGWKNIGTEEAIVINMPTRLYDYEQPDAFDLPWDSEEAHALIPFSW